MNLKKLFRLNLSQKIMLLATAITIIFGITLFGLYQEVRSSSFSERQLKVQHQTETAWAVLDHFTSMEKTGHLSREAAQQQAIAAVKKLRYGDSGYFWINDMQPAMIMHPIKPALEGKDLSASQDPSGKNLFVEFVTVCRAQGAGFVSYLWPKPGFDAPVEKISYVKHLPGWDWIIGTGLYVDDVQAALGNIRSTNFGAILLVIAVTGILTWLVSTSISRPIAQIRAAIFQLAQGHTDIQVDCGEPVDCSTAKGCNETGCPSYGKEDRCWVTAGSFAADKHCPRALRGEDCRTCELYGPKNQMQELGSALLGLANAMKSRVQLACQIADGDLTQEITISSEHDELGNALVRMHTNLKVILSQVLATAGQINTGSTTVETTSQSLTDGATRQAASLEQINSSVAEMAAQTRSNAENANQANQLANQAKGSAEKGNQQMAGLVEAMAEINQSGQNISKIIKVIDEIAFQTNLLALNAAVEAARAGQHGKGFAVVAEEVRNLAARSAKAAQETADLIEGSATKASNGAELADTTAAALTEIVSGITEATNLMGEIATASNDQAQSTDQINNGLNQIDEVGQQNAAVAHETAATAEQLASQARHLNQLLAQFKLHQTENRRESSAPQPELRQRSMPSTPVRNNRPTTTARPAAAKPNAAAAAAESWANIETAARQAPKIALDDIEFGKY